jgi:HEAT repeat protein
MPVRKVEQEIEHLSSMRDAPEGEAAPALAKALTDRVNLMVAKAAKIAGERRLVGLVPDLLRAFDRLFENAAQRDPQCWGKNAIAQALVALEYRESAPFVRGVRHLQMEPVWGGQEDTATTLRGTCALALPACSDIERGETLRLLVDALADPADPVRLDAVRTLVQMEGEEGVLLLRLKARLGDKEPAVTGQVFDGLLVLEREGAVAFVASFLKHREEATRGEAALSLGSSRLAGAVEALIACWEETRDPDLRLAVLRGLAVSRQERALDFLIEMVKDGRTRDACAAIEALSVHGDSEEIRKRMESAAEGREAEVRKALG